MQTRSYVVLLYIKIERANLKLFKRIQKILLLSLTPSARDIHDRLTLKYMTCDVTNYIILFGFTTNPVLKALYFSAHLLFFDERYL